MCPSNFLVLTSCPALSLAMPLGTISWAIVATANPPINDQPILYMQCMVRKFGMVTNGVYTNLWQENFYQLIVGFRLKTLQEKVSWEIFDKLLTIYQTFTLYNMFSWFLSCVLNYCAQSLPLTHPQWRGAPVIYHSLCIHDILLSRAHLRSSMSQLHHTTRQKRK